MKQFNLEKCIAGEKVVTRDGREFKFGAYNKDVDECCRVIGWVDERAVSVNDNGFFWKNGDESDFDLFMAEPVLYYAICEYETTYEYFISGFFNSEPELVERIKSYPFNKVIEIRTFEPK